MWAEEVSEEIQAYFELDENKHRICQNGVP